MNLIDKYLNLKIISTNIYWQGKNYNNNKNVRLSMEVQICDISKILQNNSCTYEIRGIVNYCSGNTRTRKADRKLWMILNLSQPR